MEKCFFTPRGLKVRLNPMFFLNVVKSEADYNAALTFIECFMARKNMFLFFTTLVCIFIFAVQQSVSGVTCSIVLSLVYLYGLIYTYLKPTILDTTIFLFLDWIYLFFKNGIIRYIFLGIIALITKTLLVVLIALIIQCTGAIITMIINYFIVKANLKKYGMIYNDIEICAFNMFAWFGEFDGDLKLKYSQYI